VDGSESTCASFGERPVLAPERGSERARARDLALAALERLFVEEGWLRVAEHVGDLDAVLGEIERRGHVRRRKGEQRGRDRRVTKRVRKGPEQACRPREKALAEPRGRG
jgi:hypothetical protein